MKTATLTPPIQTLDTHQFGRPHEGAAYLVRGERLALVEAGTAREADRLCAALRGERLDFLFVTHVHLDHAGGAGALAREHPEARIIVHPRAVRHLVDPSRLIEGVRAASREMFPLYGEPIPIPENRLHAAEDGERFDLGRGIEIQAVYAPGHAPHHLCFFEQEHRVLFSGDALGHHDVPVLLPLTVPPRFDRNAGRETLARLRSLDPVWIAFTHFGLAKNGVERIDAYARELETWLNRVEQLAAQGDESDVIARVFADPMASAWTDLDRQVAAMCIRGAIASVRSETS